jgi:hypothetical protein
MWESGPAMAVSEKVAASSACKRSSQMLAIGNFGQGEARL